MTSKNHNTAAAVLALLFSLGFMPEAAATNTAPAAKPPSKPVAAKPAPADTLGPGALAIKGLSFLSGKWEGELRSIPLMMDIAIDGQVLRPGKTLAFNVTATPSMGMKLPIEGDYRSVVSWSESHRALRAVMTDASGRGVEMTGGKVADAEVWLFSSTAEGAPFPFKLRVTPVNKDQVVVAYSSGGRLPLKYEVTFNRVEG